MELQEMVQSQNGIQRGRRGVSLLGRISLSIVILSGCGFWRDVTGGETW